MAEPTTQEIGARWWKPTPEERTIIEPIVLGAIDNLYASPGFKEFMARPEGSERTGWMMSYGFLSGWRAAHEQLAKVVEAARAAIRNDEACAECYSYDGTRTRDHSLAGGSGDCLCTCHDDDDAIDQLRQALDALEPREEAASS